MTVSSLTLYLSEINNNALVERLNHGRRERRSIRRMQGRSTANLLEALHPGSQPGEAGSGETEP